MAGGEGPFKKLDRFVFTSVDQYLQHPSFQKFTDLVSVLDEDQRRWLNRGLSLLFSFGPLTLVLMVFIGNCSMRSEIETRKEILTMIELYKSQKEELSRTGRNVISSSSIKDRSALQSRIRNLLSPLGNFPTANIKIVRFNPPVKGASIVESSGTLAFESLTTGEMVELLIAIIQKERAKVSGLKILKMVKGNLLQGEVDILHYGRAVK